MGLVDIETKRSLSSMDPNNKQRVISSKTSIQSTVVVGPSAAHLDGYYVCVTSNQFADVIT